MSAAALSAHIHGISVLGPGLADWSSAAEVLTGRAPYVGTPVALPVPSGLPAAERRRTGRVIRLAIAVGLAAVEHARLDPKTLPTVFSSSAGDGDNLHEICETLASAERHLSPTRFHNSVHNAPAGYWSIATGAMTASTALCACDGSFVAGLLEALIQVQAQPVPVVLIAYDCDYPFPLAQSRPILGPLGIGLVLARPGHADPIASITARLDKGPPDRLSDPDLEALRTGIPAGRGLPMLAALAGRAKAAVALDYLSDTILRADLAPC